MRDAAERSFLSAALRMIVALGGAAALAHASGVGAAGAGVGAAGAAAPRLAAACTGAASDKPVYLTFDTGHMGMAPLVADVLRREGVPATFFLSDERTQTGGSSLDEVWAPWWRARAEEGHAFGSHTMEHASWLADLPGGRFRVRPSAGAQSGKTLEWSTARYCESLQQPAERFKAMSGRAVGPIFRAPGGKTSPALLAAAKSCGWSHVGWSPAGFLGDELPSERYPNDVLLQRALRDIRSGDILVAHLGIWSRRDPWAPAVLEPLVRGLKAKGHCFATLREHRDYRTLYPR